MARFGITEHEVTISTHLFEELLWRYSNWLEDLSMNCVEDGFSADDLDNIADKAQELAELMGPCYTVNDHLPESIRSCAQDVRKGAAELRELEDEPEEQWVNHYECGCGHFWTDVWSCQCNDKCPRCGVEVEPSYSLEAGVTGGDQ